MTEPIYRAHHYKPPRHALCQHCRRPIPLGTWERPATHCREAPCLEWWALWLAEFKERLRDKRDGVERIRSPRLT